MEELEQSKLLAKSSSKVPEPQPPDPEPEPGEPGDPDD
jgi:hypothetical protein